MLKQFLLIFVSFFTFACSVQEMQEKILPEKVKAELENLNSAIIATNYLYFISRTHSSLINDQTESNIVKTLDHFPVGKVRKIELATAGYTTITPFSGSPSTTYLVSYHFEFPEKWALITYRLVDEGQGLKILGLNINVSDVSFKEINSFGNAGVTPLRISVLIWGLFSVVSIIWIFVLAAKEKHLKRKPLWLIFIILGVGGFSLNWTTEAWAFQILNFSVLGAGFSTAGPFSPWIIKVAFPLGAFIFLFLKKQGKLKYKTEKPAKV